MKKHILVVGGAGYIGSHVNKLLDQAGYSTVILDNLSKGHRDAVVRGVFVEGDMGDSKVLDRIFKSYPIDAVMHFAALIDVGESIAQPDLYYHNNVGSSLALLQQMLRHQVKKFVFSSTAAIYGIPQQPAVDEEHPCRPINPYGESKLMVEKILRDLDRAYNFKYCSLRYFNAAGGDPEGEIKNRKAHESNLIPIALRSLGKKTAVHIYGTDYPTADGTCIRDYIHVNDLGSAHLAALEKLFSGAPSSAYNLGNGEGYSVKEVIHAVERVTKQSLQVIESPRRPGDPPVLIANSKKAEAELGWRPRYKGLDAMIAHAWQALRG